MEVVREHLAARDSDTPFVLDIPPETAETGRLVAEVYTLETGEIVMVDVGWAVPDNPGHPFHVLPAPDDGPRTFEDPAGTYTIRPIIPQIEPELVRQWSQWKSVRQELDASRERAREAIEQVIGPTNPDPQA